MLRGFIYLIAFLLYSFVCFALAENGFPIWLTVLATGAFLIGYAVTEVNK